MEKMIASWTAAIAVLASAGSLAAHHSLAQFDTATPLWVKGTVVLFERVNPHSKILLDERKEGGQIQRWVVDGPGLLQLDRLRIDKDTLRAGDVIGVCGFALKEAVQAQRVLLNPPSSSLPSSAPSMSGRVMNGHVLVMPDGKKRFWSNYGVLEKCLGPGDLETLIR